MKYCFYYDESFHDRKITEKDNEMNIENIDLADNFISVVVGMKVDKVEDTFKRYSDFEIRTKRLLGLNNDYEFKGQTLKGKQFKKGISSFNKNTLEIYNDYFDIYDDKILLQISSIHKLGYVIERVINEMQFPPIVDVNAFMYSLVKFLNTYRNKKLVAVIFNEESSSQNILDEVKRLLKEVLGHIKFVKRKMDYEVPMINDMLWILDNSIIILKANNKYNWSYLQSIDGLSLLLNELGILKKDVTLIIDEEQNTLKAAGMSGFENSYEVESENCIGVRISDIFANFIGRMIKAIEEEYQEDYDNPDTIQKITERRILPKKWFCLNEEQYNLYSKIGGIFEKRKGIFWTVQTGVYGGCTSVFFALIEYIGICYSSYNEYNKIPPLEHREHFNEYSIYKEQSILNKN